MKLTKKEVLHVATLARLNIDESLIDTFAVQLGDILEYVKTLDRLDTAGVPPTFHAVDKSNAFREDRYQFYPAFYILLSLLFDGFVKSPTSALRCILRFFKVR